MAKRRVSSLLAAVVIGIAALVVSADLPVVAAAADAATNATESAAAVAPGGEGSPVAAPAAAAPAAAAPLPAAAAPQQTSSSSSSSAAAADPCAAYGRFDFAPAGASANQPAGWTRSAQAAAGNSDPHALLPIALYGSPRPRLSFLPLHPLLAPAGSPVPQACWGGWTRAGAQRRRLRRLRHLRRLRAAGDDAGAAEDGGEAIIEESGSVGESGALAAEAAPAAAPAAAEAAAAAAAPVAPPPATAQLPWATLVQPANFTWSARLDGSGDAAAGGGSDYWAEPIAMANATEAPPTWSRAVWSLPDGEHRVTITVRIAAGSAVMADGWAGRRVPGSDVEFSYTAVFHKLTERPTLKLRVDTCKDPVELVAAEMWPEPVPAPGNVGALYKPVFHVWGRYLKGLDGSPYAGEDLTNGGDVHFFDQYVIRQLGSPREARIPLTGVREGVYEMWVEGSLTSDAPSLLSLSGGGRFNQNDTDPKWLYVEPGGALEARGASLRGQPKFSGALVNGLNGTKIAVQRGPTTLASFEGPQQSIEVGQEATFTWAFVGVTNTTCAVDGRPVSNDRATGGCVSPLKIRVADELQHRLVLTTRDACAVNRREAMDFSVARGWSTEAAAGDAAPQQLGPEAGSVGALGGAPALLRDAAQAPPAAVVHSGAAAAVKGGGALLAMAAAAAAAAAVLF